MRCFILQILLLWLPVSLVGQNKTFDKLIKEYDVKGAVCNMEERTPAAFWNTVWQNNEHLAKLTKAVEKGTDAVLKAKKNLWEAHVISEPYYSTLPLVEGWGRVSDTLYADLGIRNVFKEVSIAFVIDDNYNAFTLPDGRIFIADTLILSDDFNYKNILGITAHEVAHFLLQHTFSNAYETQRKLLTNQIVAGIASAVNVAANAYAQANGAVDSGSWNNVEKTTISLFENAQNDALGRFKYKFSREQEIEADIIAYRFLEFVGYGGQHYIDALKILNTVDEGMKADKDSTHPTTTFRIALLEYLKSKDAE